MTTTDVVPTGQALPELRRLLGALEMEASQTDKAAAFDIMESLLRAETEEELFRAQEAGTVSSKDFVGRAFRLQPEDVTWKKSATQYIEQGGFPFYALLRVTDMETGDRIVIDTGAGSAVTVLFRLLEWNDDESRPISQRPFEPHRMDGGKPLMFVTKQAASGYNIVMLKPIVLEAARRGKK